MTSAQKVIKYCAMAFAIFLVVSIIGGIAGALGLLGGIFSGNNVLEETKTYEISTNITALDMEIEAADVSIVFGDKLKVESNLKHLTVKEENGTLNIKEDSKSLFNDKSKGKLVLYIPDMPDGANKDNIFTFKSAEIKTGAGVLTIEGLYVANLSMKLGAGKADIKNLHVDKSTDINGGAGQINIHSGMINNLDLDMGVGEVNLTAAVLGNSEINSGVGATNIILQGLKDSYTVHINKGIGNATVDGKSISDNESYGSGTNRIEIDGGIGSIKVKFDSTIVINEQS